MDENLNNNGNVQNPVPEKNDYPAQEHQTGAAPPIPPVANNSQQAIPGYQSQPNVTYQQPINQGYQQQPNVTYQQVGTVTGNAVAEKFNKKYLPIIIGAAAVAFIAFFCIAKTT